MSDGIQIGNEQIEPLEDGATSQEPVLSPEFFPQKDAVGDRMRPLEQRLESFDDILESEVGDTTLLRARNVEREIGIRQIFLKFEGANPTGTQKDRIAFAQVMDALRRGFDAVTTASYGNYGVAISLAASLAGLRCLIYIPEKDKSRRIQEMTKFGAEILLVPGDYDNALMLSRECAEKNEIYDANFGGSNIALQHKAYGQIAYELYDVLRDAPAAIALPVANGTTLVGIYKGFLSLRRRGKISRMPRIVAGSSLGKNPIITAFMKNAPASNGAQSPKISGLPIGESPVKMRSSDGTHALEAIRISGGWASAATDKTTMQFSRLIRECEGIHVLPESTAGLIALLDLHKKQPLTDDRYVVVLTGRGI